MSSDNSDTNITQCKEYLISQDFWDRTKEEILEMLPQQAQIILEKFGFNKILQGKYHVFESYESWLKRLSENKTKYELDEKSFNSIANNNKLRTYLEVIINLFNRNLALLNTDYTDGQIQIEYPGHYGNQYLSAIGIQPRFNFRNNSILPGTIVNLTNTVTNYWNQIKNYTSSIVSTDSNGVIQIYRQPINNLTNFKLLMMRGGGILNIGSISDYSKKYEIKQQGPLFETLINSLVTKLSAVGKNLTPEDKKHLYDHIENFKETELKLYKAIMYTEKYLELILNFKQNDPNQVLNLSHLKKFVESRESYFNKSIKKSDNILIVIGEIVSEISALNK